MANEQKSSETPVTKFGGEAAGKPPVRVSRRGSAKLVDVGRNMKLYRISRSELDHVSFLNDLSTGCFSVVGFCAGISIEGILSLAPGQWCSKSVFYPGLFAIISFVVGILMLKKRNGVMDTILSESDDA